MPTQIPWWDRRPGTRAGAKLEGAGDVVEVAASALGIKKCGGCERRRKALNRLFGKKHAAQEQEGK